MAAALAWAVFAATFVALAARRLGRIPLARGPIAIVGGLLMVAVGALGPGAALRAIDLGTLGLLLGMMLLAGTLAEGGFFGLVATRLARVANNERHLVLVTLWGGAVLSALFLNDTIALLLPPALFLVTRQAGLPAFRTLAALAIGVNLGSLWTPVGNPQNAYLATTHGIAFVTFVVHMTPIVLFGLLVASVVLAVGARANPVPERAAPVAPNDRALLGLGLYATAATLVAFLVSHRIGLPLWGVALTGGMLALTGAAAMRGAHLRVARRVDMNLLLLFVGLFLLVRGAEASGIAADVLGRLPFVAAEAHRQVAQVVVATFVASNLFSNVPAVLLLDLTVGGLGPLYPQLLAAASTLAGNTTVLASAATLIIAEQAEDHGERFPFWRFTRVGLVVAVSTLAFTVPYFVWLGA